VKRQPEEWEKIFTPSERFILKIHKELKQLNRKKIINSIKNGQRT
jgi:hypothetical protein